MATPTATGNTTTTQIRVKRDALAELQNKRKQPAKIPDFLGDLLAKVANKQLVPSETVGMDTFFDQFYFFLSNNYHFTAVGTLRTPCSRLFVKESPARMIIYRRRTAKV